MPKTPKAPAKGSPDLIPVQKIYQIPRNQIDRDPEQPRRHFDAEDIQELASSIQLTGQLYPVIIRKHPNPTKSIKYMLIGGERRWRATALLGEDYPLNCIIRDAESSDAAYILAAIDNVGREDLIRMDTARMFARAQSILRCTQGHLAKVFSVDEAYVSKHMRLLTLDPYIQAGLHPKCPKSERVSFAIAVILAGFEHKDQLRMLNHIRQTRMNNARAKMYVRMEAEKMGAGNVDGRKLRTPTPSKTFNQLELLLRSIRDRGEFLLDSKTEKFRGLFERLTPAEAQRILAELTACGNTLMELASAVSNAIPKATKGTARKELVSSRR